MTAHDCNTLVSTYGPVALFAASADAGPYCIRVGKVVCGAFGFNRSGEPAELVGENCSHDQLTSFKLAKVAFEAIKLAADDDADPADMRRIARRACKASRRTWSVFNYGATLANVESHLSYVNAEACKA